MQGIELYDRLVFETREDRKIIVECAHPFVPRGQSNLVWKATRLLQQHCQPQKGIKITIHKQIPVAAGLGGGSANAAAALKTLNCLWKAGLTRRELAGLALQVGADVPFCLDSGTALARGVGEVLTPLPTPPRLWLVLIKPNLGVSTKEVYANYQPARVIRRPDTPRLIESVYNQDVQALTNAIGNVLESVTFTTHPLLKRLKQKTMELGALAALMSGSGPTIFALTQEHKRAMTIYNGIKHQVEFSCVTTFKEGER